MREATIFALSSGAPPAAIGIVRVSGPGALAAARALAGDLPPVRIAKVRALRDAAGALLDRALVLVFAGPDSATGEDLVELHCHGGRAVVAAVERALAACNGVRRAEPGEFTRRALMNGRIDLAQAQGLADLLAAETETARRAAVERADGHLSREVAGWLDRLSNVAALIEVQFDYAEEGDVGVEDAAVIAGTLQSLADDMTAALSRPPMERLDRGIRVVLAGAPNVGKSSLFNALIGSERAIVSAIAGATRDRIEARVERGGIAYLLVDTAGLRDDTADPIEREGMGRTRQAMDVADLVLWLDDSPPPEMPSPVIALRSLADVRGSIDGRLPVSIHWPPSVDRLWNEIEQHGSRLVATDGTLFDARQREAIVRANREVTLAAGADDALIVGEHVRVARRSLASILGVDATDLMLDALFSRFCLGK